MLRIYKNLRYTDLRKKSKEQKIGCLGTLHSDFSMVRHFCWMINDFSWFPSGGSFPDTKSAPGGGPHYSNAFIWLLFLYPKSSLPLVYIRMWYSVGHTREKEIVILWTFWKWAELQQKNWVLGSVPLRHLFTPVGLKHGVPIGGITCPSVTHRREPETWGVCLSAWSYISSIAS